MEESEPYISIRTPTEWQEAAACSNRPYEWFQIPDHITPGTLGDTQRDLERGIGVCQSCPTRAACLSSASEADQYWTVRGGEWPQGLSRRPVGRPVGYQPPKATARPYKGVQRGPAAFPSGPCKRGHDRSRTGIDAKGKCYACRQDSAYRKAHPEAPEALLRPAWEYMDQCPQGHILPAVEARTGPFCPDCRRESLLDRRLAYEERVRQDPARLKHRQESRRRGRKARRERAKSAA